MSASFGFAIIMSWGHSNGAALTSDWLQTFFESNIPRRLSHNLFCFMFPLTLYWVQVDIARFSFSFHSFLVIMTEEELKFSCYLKLLNSALNLLLRLDAHIVQKPLLCSVIKLHATWSSFVPLSFSLISKFKQLHLFLWLEHMAKIFPLALQPIHPFCVFQV